jgi:hypothetical protein
VSAISYKNPKMKRVRYVGMVLDSAVALIPGFRLNWNSAKRYLKKLLAYVA